MKIKALTVGPVGTNCYILEDEEARVAAVIDPGEEADRIKKVCDQEGVEVKYILLTHGHFDHITGMPRLVELLPNPVAVYIHREDTKLRDPQLYQIGRASCRERV